MPCEKSNRRTKQLSMPENYKKAIDHSPNDKQFTPEKAGGKYKTKGF